MIKAVLFDLGGVIVNVHLELFLQRAAENSPCTPEEIGQLVLNAPQTKQYELGLLSTSGFYRWVRHALRLEMSERQFVRAFSDIFSPNEAVLQLLTQLDGRLQVGVISNTNVAHYRWIAKHVKPVCALSPAVLSFREHLAKPDQEIYALAVARAGCTPSETVFIDDLEPNVGAARATGMNAILYENPDQLKAQLQALGVALT
ncbi:MAG: HAD family phosphatase [candidate division KSB1 bacterium]|nr:HAD family phosphatase [candidate division KSB1 bacterium]